MKWLTPKNYPHVKALWDYMKLNQKPKVVDVILVFGSPDDSYVSKVVQLYNQWYAYHIICSGKGSPHLSANYSETEADHFAQLLIDQWIPHESIVREPQATSTGENMQFSYEIMKQNNWNSCIIVQKPFFERRSYATALHEHYEWWRPNTIVTWSSDVTIEQYDIINTLPLPWIHMMMWDFHRVRVCNEQWWIVYQEIPDHVHDAYMKLVKMWYDQLLMKWYPVW